MATNPLQRNEIVESTINGFTYKIEKLGAKKGRTVLVSLSRIVGPALEAKDKVAKLCELLTDSQLDALCDTFAAQTAYSPEDKPEAEFLLKNEFDKHFAGRYGSMVLWLKACLEANYGDFLKELGVDAGNLMDLLSTAMKADEGTKPDLTLLSGASSLRASEDSKK